MLDVNTVPTLSEPHPKVRAYDIQPVIPGPCLGVVAVVWVRLGGVAEWGFHIMGVRACSLPIVEEASMGTVHTCLPFRWYAPMDIKALPQVGHTAICLLFQFYL